MGLTALPIVPPRCFGLAHDPDVQECQCCLVAGRCLRECEGEAKVSKPSQDIPTDKRLLIVQVCQRYDIPTSFKKRDGSGETVSVNAVNYDQFYCIDHLLLTRAALERLLTCEFVASSSVVEAV